MAIPQNDHVIVNKDNEVCDLLNNEDAKNISLASFMNEGNKLWFQYSVIAFRALRILKYFLFCCSGRLSMISNAFSCVTP